ncbi:MAG: SUMF1/EgtB/PvdO family nonheme iron enzyme [Candidatus Schekmanbacteria bacterium]|nr:SUMF1/EgtB/PvdO family nonheme iron enzyme [Candidatus Schekmanbacteria bacterium]
MKKNTLVLAGLIASIAVLSIQAEVTADSPEGMVLIPAGEFTMGIDAVRLEEISTSVEGMTKYLESATPACKVNLPAYFIDKYEVTNEDYKKFIGAAGHAAPEDWEDGNFPAGKGKFPVAGVSLEDAKAYAKWAGKRLPTEAEWEKAARGGDGRLFPWGEKFEKGCANTDEAGKGATVPVGSYEKGKSPYGVWDLAGNVWEWTADNYLPYPGNTFPDEFYGKERYVLRGGSFADLKNDALSILRSKFTAITTDENVGFRCAKDAK